MDVSRRRFLGGFGAAAAGLAGCIDRGPGRTSTAIFVTNELDEEMRVTLRCYELPPEWDPESDDDDDGEGGEDEREGDDDEREGDDDGEEGPDTEDLEQVLLRRGTLEPEGSFSVDGAEVPDADLRIGVVTTGGPDGEYDWDRVDERSTIDVRLRQNGVQFLELD